MSEPFVLLSRLYCDPVMDAVFSERETVGGWLEAERALAAAQATLGMLTPEQAEAIAEVATPDRLDLDALWRDARTVGYPILPLVRQLAAAVEDDAAGRIHYGATTQDIMDTGLALQLRAALDRLEALVERLATALAVHVEVHRGTVMPGRTHAQQAVPTTLGAKLAVFLGELARHRDRLRAARPRVTQVSLYGAAGTSAALGPRAAEIRERMARLLGLGADRVPWHVARDGVAEHGLLCGMLAATCARFAREVIELARTEIGELAEAAGHHRGASSTMPQKANPVRCEAVVGLAASAESLAPALLRAMEPGHERAAGEWQIEWFAVPMLSRLAAGCLCTSAEVAEELHVDAAAMARNLARDHGLILAEAHMIRLAGERGREAAHDAVYEAALEVRRSDRDLSEVLGTAPIDPQEYVGDAAAVCDAALAQYRTRSQPSG